MIQKTALGVIWAGLVLMPSLAFANPININSTGNGSTTDGAVDPNWTYTNSVPATGQGLVANNPGVDFFNGAPPWVSDSNSSSWIVDNIANPQSGGGALSFSTTFSLAGLNPLTASLSGAWAIDDTGVLELNGHIISTLGTAGFSWFTLNAFSVSGSSGDFLSGINVLSAVLTNNDNFFEGTNVQVTGTADPLISATPIPAALPLFAGGLGLMGFFARRKKRHAAA
jgi:hypothetical protein